MNPSTPRVDLRDMSHLRSASVVHQAGSRAARQLLLQFDQDVVVDKAGCVARLRWVGHPPFGSALDYPPPPAPPAPELAVVHTIGLINGNDGGDRAVLSVVSFLIPAAIYVAPSDTDLWHIVLDPADCGLRTKDGGRILPYVAMLNIGEVA